MNGQSSTQNVATEIEQEYQEFLAKLDVLKKEQEQLIKEYREKLEQRKFLPLLLSQSSPGLPGGECGLRYFGMLVVWKTACQATVSIVPSTMWSGYQNIGGAF